MNPSSESYDAQSDFHASLVSSNDIIDAEIIEPHGQNEPINLEIVNLYHPFPESASFSGQNTPHRLDFLLTPWGLGAITLLLTSNILLAWAQWSEKPSVETVETSPETSILENNIPQSSPKQEITAKNVSVLPEPSKNPLTVPLPPTIVQKVPSPPVSNPPPPSDLSRVLLPPSLRPQPQRVQPLGVQPSAAVQVSIPMPAPPTVQDEKIEPPIPEEPPELSKEEQLRNILRQQIVKEETESKPQPTFYQKYRQEIYNKKLQTPITTPETPPLPTAPLTVSQPPKVISPATPRSASNPNPQNVDQLVNQLEGLNQR